MRGNGKMSKMRDAILNAVILIAMDDDQSLHELIQYMVTDLLSDNFMIDFSNDAETSEEYLNNCLVPDNQNNINKNITDSVLYWERMLEFEEEKAEILNKLIQLMAELNGIQQERNNILKSIIEMYEITPFIDEKTEVYFEF